jgi:ribonuclease-3
MKITHINKLEESIGYHFIDHNLLTEALSHPSLKQHATKNDSVKNYERLELLGDSILSFVITEILFKNFSLYSEGKLAKIRSHLVCKERLCDIANSLNLAEYIIMTYGEELGGGRTNPNNIENAMEALIGAIYLDSDINVVKKIIHNLWAEFLLAPDLAISDPKTTLQELTQAKFGCKPIYEVINKEGLAHSTLFTVKVTVNNHYEIGRAYSVKKAEKEAAEKFLTKFSVTNTDDNS